MARKRKETEEEEEQDHEIKLRQKKSAAASSETDGQQRRVLLVPGGGVDHKRVKKSSKELWLVKIPPNLDFASLDGSSFSLPAPGEIIPFSAGGDEEEEEENEEGKTKTVSLSAMSFPAEESEALNMMTLLPSEKHNQLLVAKPFSRLICIAEHQNIVAPKAPKRKVLPTVSSRSGMSLQYPLYGADLEDLEEMADLRKSEPKKKAKKSKEEHATKANDKTVHESAKKKAKGDKDSRRHSSA